MIRRESPGKREGFGIVFMESSSTTRRSSRSQSNSAEEEGLIQANEGIQSDQFALLYEGKLLKEDMPVASLNMKSEATLYLVCSPKPEISISVKAPTEEIVKLKVKVLFTVHDVKAIIGAMIGSSVTNLNLFYAELPRQFQIFVKTWRGKTITLDVQLSDTTKDMKEKLLNKAQISLKLHHFVFAGKRLEEDRDLASYNVQKHSTLHMVFSPRAGIVPVALSQFRKALSESTTISKLKDMIQQKFASLGKVKELQFNHMALENRRTLGDYRLGKRSTVNAVF